MYERICKDCGKPFCGKCGLDDQYSHISTEEISRFECTRCKWRVGPMGYKAEPNHNVSCEACSGDFSAQARAMQGPQRTVTLLKSARNTGFPLTNYTTSTPTK